MCENGDEYIQTANWNYTSEVRFYYLISIPNNVCKSNYTSEVRFYYLISIPNNVVKAIIHLM